MSTLHRRSFLNAAAVSSLAAQTSTRTPPPTRPLNVLILLFDKCRTDAIGAYGNPDVHTPNLDWLARTGTRFANCYTPTALCGPARSSILTGLYPHAHGVRRNVYADPPSKPSQATYPERVFSPFLDPRFHLWENFPTLLHVGGYETGHIGKWHLGLINPGCFDTWKSFNSLLPHWVGKPHESPYRPDVHTTQGIEFIERNVGRPFFLYQSYYAPHEPLDPPKQFLPEYRGKDRSKVGYYGSVSNLDWNVGRILDTLRKTGLIDRTLIIATTEHGCTWMDRPGATSEGLCVPYDEASRIPMIVRCPSLLPQGKVWDSGVSLVDLMPTILDATGIWNEQPVREVQGGADDLPALQGRSWLQEIHAGQDTWKRPIITQNIARARIDGSFSEDRAIRMRNQKLILRKFETAPFFRPGEFYDLSADPGELHNLYASTEYRPAIEEMRQQLLTWGRQTKDQLSVELAQNVV